MIDIHTHILPEVDDGSENLTQSLEMLNVCALSGITDVILTPHYRNEMKPSSQMLIEQFNKFCLQVKEAGINVNLFLGQEIYVDENCKANLSNGKVHTMNGTKYVLVEFDFEKENDIAEIVYEIVAMGYKPIVAHPERYYYVELDTIHEIKNLGGLIQVNAQSIVSAKSFKRKKFIKNLFKQGLVDFVASDVHYLRDNNMLKAYKYVQKKFGDDVANKVFEENAQKLIKG